jgi:hypothetical protein
MTEYYYDSLRRFPRYQWQHREGTGVGVFLEKQRITSDGVVTRVVGCETL